MADTTTILIDCDDAKGLIFKITDLIYEFDLNIIRNREFVAHDSGHFFMRTVVSGPVDRLELKEKLAGRLPNGANIRMAAPGKKRILVLATKEHHVLGDLLIRHEFGELNAEIAGVVSNHEVLKKLVTKFDVPWHHVSHENMSREEHEKKVMDVIESYEPEYLVLAKYMRILTPGFVSAFGNRIINIHHSFLPAFVGAQPYHQAHQRGVKVIGATAHFVNNELDEGPIITQSTEPVNHTYGVEELVQKGREIESRVLAEALRMVFDDKVFIHENKTIILD